MGVHTPTGDRQTWYTFHAHFNVDGTGMCGACRVTVGGETKFACVDGPDFNAHLIDFDEVINRCRIYKDEERKRSENCNLIKMANKI